MFQKKKNEKKKKFVPIYSFFSSNSDGLCLIFTSVYINYASHYGREDGRLFTARGGDEETGGNERALRWISS